MSLEHSDITQGTATEQSAATSRSKSICIVGLGYVGLPLAIAFDRAGHQVAGYDIDETKVEQLSEGVDVTGEMSDEAVAESDVAFSTNPALVGEVDYVVVTVPTPVDETQTPDLRFVEAAGRTVGEHLSPGSVVVLESTVYPGATRDVFVPAIEASSGLDRDQFHVAYSPERLAPGGEGKGLSDVVKVVGADDDEVRDSVSSLYETVVDAGVHEVDSMEAAEAAKNVENIQRDLNIALVNELAIVFDRMSLDTQEVLDAARTKWNFHDYTPGLVGGHCIPVDPFYFAYGSEMAGYSPKLTLKAREINEYMPRHVADLVLKALNDTGNVISESKLLVLGLSYKPNVSDIRTSEVSSVISELHEYDVDIVGYDPYADPEAVHEEFGIEVQETVCFDGFDGVLIPTPHEVFDEIDFTRMRDRLADDPFVVDVMGHFDEDALVDAGFDYRRL